MGTAWENYSFWSHSYVSVHTTDSLLQDHPSGSHKHLNGSPTQTKPCFSSLNKSLHKVCQPARSRMACSQQKARQKFYHCQNANKVAWHLQSQSNILSKTTDLTYSSISTHQESLRHSMTETSPSSTPSSPDPPLTSMAGCKRPSI